MNDNLWRIHKPSTDRLETDLEKINSDKVFGKITKTTREIGFNLG